MPTVDSTSDNLLQVESVNVNLWVNWSKLVDLLNICLWNNTPNLCDVVWENSTLQAEFILLHGF